jgi:phosphatidate phosphatase APP1
MAFLILTEGGYQDLNAMWGRPPSPLWINPGILSPDEVQRLRGAGVQLTIMINPVNPHSRSEVEQVVKEMVEAGLIPVWVEHTSPGSLSPVISKDGLATDPLPSSKALGKSRSNAQALYGRTLHYIKRLAASDGPAVIVPHMSYGTPSQLHVQGRVLESRAYGAPSHDHSAWSNIVDFYRQLGTDEVPEARLLARIGGIEQEILADRNGYFHADLDLPPAVETSGWQSVELELLHPAPRKGENVTATAQVLIPPATARFGVISDIDDTLLWSNVGNKLRMLKMLALSNAHTRKPFKGVTAFYCALQQGASGNENNPIFYVSSSPWNLYTSLVDFFNAQGIPLGPLALKELGFKALFGKSRHHDHKLAHIERILQTYPHLPFILIGDSGQHDPEIYKEIVERHPKRILAIYIRSVNPDPARIEAIDRLIEEVKTTNVQLLLVPDSEFAATHAAGQGWIKGDVLNAIRSDKRDDERLTNPKV